MRARVPHARLRTSPRFAARAPVRAAVYSKLAMV
jgi:hypothetical protein